MVAGDKPTRSTSEPATLVAAWVAVLVGGACGLRILDAIPRLVLGEGRGIERCADLTEAEARLGRPIAIPAYFPAHLAWPPATILFAYGPPPAIAVAFSDSRNGETRLTLFQSASGAGVVPAAIRPEVEAFHEVAIELDGHAATLLRIRTPRGEIWDEIHWSRDDMSFVVRYRGPGEDALRIATSLARRR